jgi:hypothetical protein
LEFDAFLLGLLVWLPPEALPPCATPSDFFEFDGLPSSSAAQTWLVSKRKAARVLPIMVTDLPIASSNEALMAEAHRQTYRRLWIL